MPHAIDGHADAALITTASYAACISKNAEIQILMHLFGEATFASRRNLM